MSLPSLRRAAALLVALNAAACSSSPAPAGPSDAATTDAPLSADVPPSTDAPSTSDGGACADFSGAYTLVGTCTVAGFSPFPSACVQQTGCSTQITVLTGPTTGTVQGDRMSFSSMVSGIALACVATRSADGTLSVHCDAGGIASCDAVGTPASFPGAARWCCNPSAQDCGGGQRCAIVGVGTNNATAITACVPAGSTAEGAACTRVDNRLGADDCAAGSSCVNYGQATAGSRTCQRLCRSTADCAGGSTCIASSDSPRAGICRPSCALFGSDCPSGTCRSLNSYGATDPETAPTIVSTTCVPVGAAAEGAACGNSNDCAANLACVRSSGADPFACRPLCDMTHPCAAGTCSGTAGATNPTGAGACLP